MNLDAERPPGASHLFTIRLWREDLGAEQSEWRGRVVHARSGETCYFRDWAALLAFVQTCLEESSKETSSASCHDTAQKGPR